MTTKVLWKGIRFNVAEVTIYIQDSQLFAQVIDNYALLPSHLWLYGVRPVRFTEVFEILRQGEDVKELVDTVLETIDSSYADATCAIYRRELNERLH